MSINVKSVEQFLQDNKAFTNGGMRNLIFHENDNGFKKFKVIFRIGRKVMINEDNFYKWLDSIN